MKENKYNRRKKHNETKSWFFEINGIDKPLVRPIGLKKERKKYQSVIGRMGNRPFLQIL